MRVAITSADVLMSPIRTPCAQHIAAIYRTYTDIIYNNTSGLWACCSASDDALHCESPRPETFQATPLDQLKPLSELSKTLAATAVTVSSSTEVFSSTIVSSSTERFSSTIVSSSTERSSSTIKPTERSDPILGSGAKAGIVAGAVIACVLILAGMVLVIKRLKRRKRVDSGGLDHAADQPADVFTGSKPELDSRVRAELDVTAPAELDARSIYEIR
ncbi:hypothetical protein MMC07_004831 [Pseudocyphellaria aurata]|nr:hypothetical protein [Pseudocyphellaria aurata]